MDWERRSIRICAAAVCCAVVLRLTGSGMLRPLAAAFSPERLASLVFYLETGRAIPPETEPPSTKAAEPTAPLPDRIEPDMDRVQIKYSGTYRPDLPDRPISLNLRGDEPTVLILHTHTSESYTKQSEDSWQETSDYHTLDEEANMLRVGDAVAARLEAAGIGVIHDRSFHDVPSYNGSYNHARQSAEQLLAEYPGIRLVLDLHRDAVEVAGGQLDTAAWVKDQESAQLMFVVGTDEGGLEHPSWQENLALAAQLDGVLEAMYPGICRPISLRRERFNQHLSPGALLVEVGAAGNTLAEALVAADALCDGILALTQ